MANKIQELAEGFKDIVNVSGNVKSSLDDINNSVLKTGNSIDAMQSTVKNLGVGLDGLGKGITRMSSVVPGLGLIGETLGDISSTAGTLIGVTNQLGDAFMDAIKVGDALTQVNREMAADNYKLAAQFGESIDMATKFTDFMLGNAERLSGADYGFQDFATETRPMVSALAQNRISFDKMQESIRTTSGTYDLYSMAVLQANALGVDSAEYARLMSSVMIDQGMSVQGAAETLALYGDIAERTGLTVSSVADTLNGLGNQFRTMGLDADFGQSYLDGFVESLEKTGIGIENATDLARTFGSAMANLSTNYSSSFITAQRGGLDQGSGGALGAGIQMQARLMDPNANQAELGKDLASAVRDTIASFTGGDIVTVQDAAQSRDPRMEQAFYAQSQLLSQMYGITDSTDQARTLELLQQMSEVQAVGDEQAMSNLGEQLTSALNMRQETLSNEERLNRLGTAQLAELNLHTKILGQMLFTLSDQELVTPAGSMMESGFDSLNQMLQSNEGSFEEAFSNYMNNREDSLFGSGDRLISKISEMDMPVMPTSESMDTGVVDYLKNSTLSFDTQPIVTALDRLADRFETIIKGMPNNGGQPGLAGANKGSK